MEETRVNGGESNPETLGSGSGGGGALAAAVSPAGDSSDMLRAILKGIRMVSHVPSALYLLVHFRRRSFSVSPDGGRRR